MNRTVHTAATTPTVDFRDMVGDHFKRRIARQTEFEKRVARECGFRDGFREGRSYGIGWGISIGAAICLALFIVARLFQSE